MSDELKNLPPLLLPFSKKTKEWRKKNVDWADGKTFFNYSLVRKSVIHKKINYDLLNGKLHMSDLLLILNPDSIKAGYIPDRILHYPIMNSKLNVLIGEESKRVFDFKVVVTNPNAISEKENNKKLELFARLQLLFSNTSLSEEEFNAKIEELNKYYTYEWQDLREIRANALLNHYMKEYNIPLLFNTGFVDPLAIGEEMYLCDIVGGEPVIEKLNPLKVRLFKSGYSNKVEDADVIVIEDYWSPGRIIDTYYDVLTNKDIEYIENIPSFESSTYDGTDNYDERDNFILADTIDSAWGSDVFFDPLSLFGDSPLGSRLYYDRAGNIRVLRVYWKSRRKIKRVKSYDPETGEEVFNFYPETYIVNEALGEEELSFWINEAWEGTKIGAQIYVNMRPRVVLYNRLSNPSRCHFGIIGSIYNMNDSRPFSLVDMMKPYNYLYDAIHDRLNKELATNWGKILELDLASIPKGWDIEKWMYYAKINHLALKDSFKEGNAGAAKGKLAGALTQTNRGVIDVETGNSILLKINLLLFIDMELSLAIGISRQREGLISNNETVGGVERANLLSSHITERLFLIHEDVKRRVLEAFLETAKVALKGRSKKFNYLMSDLSLRVMEIDGDEFADADYGLVVDNSQGTLALNQKLDMLALAALLNSTLTFSAIMKLYSSTSMSEKIRLVEMDEQMLLQRALEALKQQLLIQLQLIQAESEAKEAELLAKDLLNIRDNETKILIALMNASNKEYDEEENPDRTELDEKIREFNERLNLDKLKLDFEKDKHRDEFSLKKSEKSGLKNKK